MSLIGRAARNHPKQVAHREAFRHQLQLIGQPIDVVDSVDDRRTPPSIFLQLHDRHRFTVDAAASDENHLLPLYWTRNDDGLSQDWSGHRVWCNPPYSDLPAWVAKASGSVASGYELVVMLLPANRTEQGWWHEWVEPFRDRGLGITTHFIRGRLRFGRPAGAPIPVGGDRPPFGLVLVTWEVLV